MNKISHTSDILAAEQELRDTFYTRHGKRAFDLTFAILLLPLLLPIIFILALLVKLDGGPAFFGHKRVGMGGREFRCLKIRSMRPDAERYLEKFLADDLAASAEWIANFKLRHDPRITKLGKFLRKSSLDELPQIFNVILGEMSFVGPRPVSRDELIKYGVTRKLYEIGRPGVTGPWQINARGRLNYSHRVDLDEEYRLNEGFYRDIKIIIRTPVQILKMSGN